MSIISENLRRARKAIDGLSQDRAAKLLGVKRSTLDGWERSCGTPHLSIFPKIAGLYNITDWVGFITDEQFDPKKQPRNGTPRTSLIEERYKKLSKPLRRVADELLKLS